MGRPEADQRELVLEMTLAVAVPLWIDRLASMEQVARQDAIWKWSRNAADAVSRHDALPELTEVATLNALARGLAALAWCRGGVQFLDILWCSEHSPCGRPPLAWEAACAPCVTEGLPVEEPRFVRVSRDILTEVDRGRRRA